MSPKERGMKILKQHLTLQFGILAMILLYMFPTACLTPIFVGHQWSASMFWSAGIIPPENFSPSPDAERFGVLEKLPNVPNINIF